MGKNSIERGSRDTWTPAPRRYQEVATRMAAAGQTGGRGGEPASAERDTSFWAEMRKPEHRDPRGYIIPSSQPDFATATRFINALRETNIAVHRATADFEVLGKKYPAGSYVVFTAQAFRPHVIDMFEPQDHPDNFPYPGAPPTPPYDNAGWTLAFQMGVEFHRILEGFTGPFEKVTDWNVKPPPGKVTSLNGAAGYLVSHEAIDSFVTLNRLLGEGGTAHWIQTPLTANGRTWPAGTFYIPASAATTAAAQKVARERGLSFEATREPVPPGAWALKRPRVGLWDQYGGSIDAGWARWILEQFEFAFDRVFPPALDAGNLASRYDVLVFVEGGIPSVGDTGSGGGRGAGPPAAAPADIPEEFRGQVGRVTVEKTLPQIRGFLESGGTVVAIGDSAANLAQYLRLPLENHLAERGVPLPRTKFYVPGSVLAARVDTTHPIGHGLRERTDVFFDNSPVFALGADAAAGGIKPIAWFDSAAPLRSGWAWGQQYLDRGVVAVEARVGKGKALLFGPEILKRAQPHATFKLLFNSLYASARK
jgi:hypothetical protein